MLLHSLKQTRKDARNQLSVGDMLKGQCRTLGSKKHMTLLDGDCRLPNLIKNGSGSSFSFTMRANFWVCGDIVAFWMRSYFLHFVDAGILIFLARRISVGWVCQEILYNFCVRIVVCRFYVNNFLTTV